MRISPYVVLPLASTGFLNPGIRPHGGKFTGLRAMDDSANTAYDHPSPQTMPDIVKHAYNGDISSERRYQPDFSRTSQFLGKTTQHTFYTIYALERAPLPVKTLKNRNVPAGEPKHFQELDNIENEYLRALYRSLVERAGISKLSTGAGKTWLKFIENDQEKRARLDGQEIPAEVFHGFKSEAVGENDEPTRNLYDLGGWHMILELESLGQRGELEPRFYYATLSDINDIVKQVTRSKNSGKLTGKQKLHFVSPFEQQ